MTFFANASAPENSFADEDQLISAWHAFINTRMICSTVSRCIVASWQRCMPYLNPLDALRPVVLNADHLIAAQAANFDLISVARPVMEDIYQFLEGTEIALVLANNAGCILDRLGDPSMLRVADYYGFVPGSMISESQIGTNAFALSLTERMPLVVRGAEHFVQLLHKIVGAAAPIFDLTGAPLGTFGLVAPFNRYTPHMLALATAGALSIDSQRRSDILLAEQHSHLAQLNTILSTIAEGVMVWDANGILLQVNASAEKIFDMPAPLLVGKHFRAYFSFPPFMEEAMQRCEQLLDVKAKVRIGDYAVNLILSLKFVFNKNKLAWTIMTVQKEADVIERAQHRYELPALKTLSSLEGESIKMRRVRQVARVAVPAKAPVLICGEAGTGKNLLASAIHNEGLRREEPFVIYSCDSIPREQMMLELLSNEKGVSTRHPLGLPGKVELAQSGTLYIQDIDALSLDVQIVLLNLIELGIIQRQGSSRPILADVRIIAATSADLNTLISQGHFRPDLYYRLSPFEIRLPPLRARIEDLPLLTEKTLKRFSAQYGYKDMQVSPEALMLLQGYSWPGNLKELEAVLWQASSQLNNTRVILPEHLPEFIHYPVSLKIDISQIVSASSSLQDTEREALLQSVRVCRGNINKMVSVLGISRTTLWRKLRQYDISTKDFRPKQSSKQPYENF